VRSPSAPTALDDAVAGTEQPSTGPLPTDVPDVTSEPIPFMDLAAAHVPLAGELDEIWRSIVTRSAFIGGSELETFEDAFAAYCERQYCVGVANGTESIELILTALGIGRGDEVIVPANTFVGSVEAIVAVGATPVFVDVEPDRLLVTAETVQAGLSDRTSAVLVVHLFGQPVDMDGILQVAERARIAVVEDAAQAHGARWRGRRAGSFGVAASFSFYPGKNLGAFGDGGAVVTDDVALAERVRSLANHGRQPGLHHAHTVVGRNSRLDGLQAAVLRFKLSHLDGWNAARAELHCTYQRMLGEVHGVRTLGEDAHAESVHHLEVVRVAGRDRVQRRLAEAGIGTGIHYPVPCHLEGPYRQYATTPLPIAEEAASAILSLPMYPQLSHEALHSVCSRLSEAVLAETRVA
jgi:dTDP-4-amino-4,6-dideoxygalactose transaminase